MEQCAPHKILVRGNHDILSDETYQKAGLEVIEGTYLLEPFILSHEPLSDSIQRHYVISAHIHPGVRMVGNGRQKLSLPCFYFGENEGILPAFGNFTGLYLLEPEKAKSIFAIVDEHVLHVHGERLEI